ncbi:Rrf2 family transcriptional regulator [Pseudomonas sp. Irchel 3A7]|uniref:RrF2 family transcriptional regulator n=1 Tax=Pseudomonas sp. Irchel 3A7 TaxID=2008913 RepID=UPI000BA35BD9|nr:Rrf2 family transcriptional regulator [Pseudomonas sp. Irchel 3A7]
MTHISTGVEYGLHCLLYLVNLPKGISNPSVRDLAELQGVPIEYLAKVFNKLRKAGLVNATEGVSGGYRLARPSENITVLDVVRAIDGQKGIFDCKNIRGRCAVFIGQSSAWASQGTCKISSIMYEAQTRLEESLAMHTLAHLTYQVIASEPVEHQDSVMTWLQRRRQYRH